MGASRGLRNRCARGWHTTDGADGGLNRCRVGSRYKGTIPERTPPFRILDRRIREHRVAVPSEMLSYGPGDHSIYGGCCRGGH